MDVAQGGSLRAALHVLIRFSKACFSRLPCWCCSALASELTVNNGFQGFEICFALRSRDIEIEMT